MPPLRLQGGGQQSRTQTQATSFTNYSAGFPQRVTIQIPVYDRGFAGWNVTDNYWTRWIQKEFGDKYNVTVQYVSIGRSTEAQDILALFAAGRGPTVAFHYDTAPAMNYNAQGIFQQLNYNEVAYYAPTFWAINRNSIESFGTINGESIFVFSKRPASDTWTTLIRRDWVERAGYRMEQLTNLETFNQMLLRWRELGLGTYGHAHLQNNYTFNYAFRSWPINRDEHILYTDLNVVDLTTAATKAWLKDMNWKYNNRVLDQEWFLRTDDARLLAEFVAGRTGTIGLYLTSNRHVDVMNATIANNPGATFAVLPPYALVPRGGVPQGRAYYDFGAWIGVNHQATAEQRAALWMLMEWMSQPEVIFTLQNGHAGVHYNLQPNGLPARIADYSGEAVLSPNGNKDYWMLVVEGPMFSDELFWEYFWTQNAPPGYGNLTDDIIKNYQATAQYRYPEAIFTVALPTRTENLQDLNQLFQQLYVRIIRAPIAQFEQVYADACNEYLRAGYQAIIDERQRAIRDGNYVY